MQFHLITFKFIILNYDFFTRVYLHTVYTLRSSASTD